MVLVGLRKLAPLRRQVVQRKNCRDRTHRHARATIDAFLGIDVELWGASKISLVLLWMNAIHWASIHACSVFYAYARLGDYVSHSFPFVTLQL